MAQDLQLDIVAGPAVTMPTADVTDTNSTALFGGAAAVGLDLGAQPPLELGYKWIQTTLTGATGPAYLFAHWSQENTTFSDISNGELVGVMDCTASADCLLVYSFPVRGRYLKFHIENQSGGTLDFTASNSAMTVWDVTVDQA